MYIKKSRSKTRSPKPFTTDPLATSHNKPTSFRFRSKTRSPKPLATDPLSSSPVKSRSPKPTLLSNNSDTQSSSTKALNKKDSLVLDEYTKTRFYSKFSKNPKIHLIKRIGVIPYVNSRCKQFIDCLTPESSALVKEEHIKGNGIWFAMGVDAKYMELTDFGGMVEKGEDVFSTANRELVEESATIFDIGDLSDNIKSVIMNSPCVVYTTKGPIRRDIIDMCTVFINFTKTVCKDSHNFPYNLNDKFQHNREKILLGVKQGHIKNEAPYIENYTSYWIPDTELADVLRKRTPFVVSKKKFHNSFIQSEFSPLKIAPDKPSTHPLIYEKVRISIFPNFFNLIKEIY